MNPFWEKYTALQQRSVFPARTILLHEGKTAQNYYFVEQGWTLPPSTLAGSRTNWPKRNRPVVFDNKCYRPTQIAALPLTKNS
jgi:hypothetical protein